MIDFDALLPRILAIPLSDVDAAVHASSALGLEIERHDDEGYVRLRSADVRGTLRIVEGASVEIELHVFARLLEGYESVDELEAALDAGRRVLQALATAMSRIPGWDALTPDQCLAAAPEVHGAAAFRGWLFSSRDVVAVAHLHHDDRELPLLLTLTLFQQPP